MTQETKKPLYKQLNEQRTRGEWKAQQGGMNEYDIATKEMTIATVLAIDIPDEEGEANARLAALAVNELANLAGALELLKANFEANKKFGTLPNQQELEAGLSIINTALSRIS